ncbi:MAG: XkdX family protein [Dehalobacter sp. 4CP]|nr:XkdX family protein [Dehalobacter sp.]NBJ14452.1 XkdX family protein [Dehalobacter sp. 4CP]
MSIFVESLKRLYTSGKVTIEKLNNLLTESKITQEEYDYITAQ